MKVHMNRGILLVCITGFMLLTTTGPALAAEEDGLLRGMWQLLMEAIGNCGDTTNAGGDIAPSSVDGTGNTLIQIENMEIVFNTGDIDCSTPAGGNDADREIIYRLMDQAASSQHPSWQEPPRMQFHEGFPQNQYNLHEQLEFAPPMHDPELFRLMMRVGKLAWESIEFREQLERLVKDAEQEM